MPEWEQTTSSKHGTYRRFGPNELYVRCDNPLGWSWFLDGLPGGVTGSEASAQAEAELAARSVARTHTGRMAAAAA